MLFIACVVTTMCYYYVCVCVPLRTNESLPCGGPQFGQCVCGKCECYPVIATGDVSKRYRGKYCQCNDYSCDHYMKQICGGSYAKAYEVL